jgi:hypothetical protein
MEISQWKPLQLVYMNKMSINSWMKKLLYIWIYIYAYTHIIEYYSVINKSLPFAATMDSYAYWNKPNTER